MYFWIKSFKIKQKKVLQNKLNWLCYFESSALVKQPALGGIFMSCVYVETASSLSSSIPNPTAPKEGEKKDLKTCSWHPIEAINKYKKIWLFNHRNSCNTSSINVLYYCKYYRNNISYCIQKNCYLPLYRKIKSLLYIQIMAGVRCLAWKQDYNIYTQLEDFRIHRH